MPAPNAMEALFGPSLPAANNKPDPNGAPDAMTALFGKALAEPEAVVEEQLARDPDKTMGFTGAAVGSLASDPTEYTRYVAQRLYPDEPLDQAVKRIGRTA